MKILHLVNVFASAGGIETYVLDLLPLLKARGHDNVLIYRKQHPRTPVTENQAIYHIPISKNPSYDRRRIFEILETESPDIVYLHDIYDPILIKQVAKLLPTIGYVHIFYPVCPGLGKLFRKSDVVCERAFGLGCIPNIYLQQCASARHPKNVIRIMRQTRAYLDGYRDLASVVIASKYMQNLMVQNGISKDRTKILPYFIPIPEESHIYGIDKNCQDIMFAGRLEYEKGVPYLIEALKEIPDQHKLLIAGEGSLQQNYKKQAHDLGVSDRVEFLGWLTGRDLDKAYQRCAVTVMPSIMPEPFGKVGVEAMANKRPVVAFDVGGIPDWLKNNHNGFLISPRDVHQLAVKINILLQDHDFAERLGTNGRNYVLENYSTEKHIDALLLIMDEAITSEK